MLNVEFAIQSITATSASTYRVQASVQASENDPNLLDQVYAKVNWGDGVIQPVNVGSTNLVQQTSSWCIYYPELIGTIYHDYAPGNFSIVVTAYNLRSPNPDSVSFYDKVSLASLAKPAPVTPTIVGPILPSDSSYPNEQQWLLNTDSDVRLLASNVKMILITNIGERLWMPTYGTTLRSLLFQPNDDTTQGSISAEVARAIAAWEPRVTFQSLSVTRYGTSINVVVQLLSNLTRQPFSVAVSY